SLDPEHVADVELRQHALDVVADLHTPGRHIRRDERRRPHQGDLGPIFTSPKLSDRATRECSTSPTIPTRRPSRRPSFSRIVYRSSSPCVGCSCVPSPALSTWASTHRVSWSGEPLEE